MPRKQSSSHTEGRSRERSATISWRLLARGSLFHGLEGGFKTQSRQVEAQEKHIADEHGLGGVGQAEEGERLSCLLAWVALRLSA